MHSANVHYYQTIENCIRHLVANTGNVSVLDLDRTYTILRYGIDMIDANKNYLLIFRLVDKQFDVIHTRE